MTQVHEVICVKALSVDRLVRRSPANLLLILFLLSAVFKQLLIFLSELVVELLDEAVLLRGLAPLMRGVLVLKDRLSGHHRCVLIEQDHFTSLVMVYRLFLPRDGGGSAAHMLRVLLTHTILVLHIGRA